MEGVGARLGRSSTRYGPATVFTGPVRKWKKMWVHVTPPNSENSGNANHIHHQGSANGGVNGNNGSHVLLLKWTPVTARQNNNNNNNNSSNGGVDKNDDSKSSEKDDVVAPEEPRKRKFKYIPIAVLEEQKNESLEDGECEVKPIETERDVYNLTAKGLDEKPNVNDATMEEDQAPEGSNLQEHNLNESTLDLSLGLAGDEENE